MRAFAGLALASGTVSVVGLGSSCGAGDSGAVPVTVAISTSPVISIVNARVAGGERAHLGGGVVGASSSRSLGTGRARWRRSGSGKYRQNCWYYCWMRRALVQSGAACTCISLVQVRSE